MSEAKQNTEHENPVLELDAIKSGSGSNAQQIEDTIKILKSKRKGELPDVTEIKKQLDPDQHKVMDPTIRKDKKVRADDGEEADAGTRSVMAGGKKQEIRLRTEKVSRIALGYQSLIVNRAVAFCFGNPVQYSTNTEDAKEQEVQQALERILYDNKEKYLNREIARELFSFTEVAELWFPVAQENQNYGFKSNFKLRCIILKPSDGVELFPFFDLTGNLLAFSRAFKVKEDDKDVEYFETYTDETIFKWVKKDGWEVAEGYPIENVIGKIPVVYAKQAKPEWYPVQNIIESDEELRSNFSDTNKYHSSPTIVAKGKINGFAKKGEAGKLIEVAENADVKYLEWSNAAASVEAEHRMNKEDIFAISQTPEISFNTVKGIGNVSGVTLKMMFLDAHLKVMDKEEILGEYLQRRVNVIKAFIANFDISKKEAAENVMITPEITPYMIGDDKEIISNISTAISGGFMSRKTGINTLGWVQDDEKEYDQILAEERESAMMDIMPPSV